MLHVIKELENLEIRNEKESLGYLSDFYIDDLSWTTRYVVVDTGKWLTGKKVLVSPHSIKKPDFLENVIYTNLSKEQIEKSPHVSEKEPVSRQNEIDLQKYYGWPAYWTITPSMQEVIEENKKSTKARKGENDTERDSHLRSIREIRKYYIEGINGEIGIVDGFVIDDDKWLIKYLVLDTRKWLHWLPGGKKILITPEWIRKIEWNKSKMFVDLDKETIEKSPEFKSAEEIDEKYENKLFACYKEFIDKKIINV